MTGDRRILSLDVNPIVVGSAPDDCAALDAVVFESGEEGGTP